MTDKPLHYLDSGIFSVFLNGQAEPDNFPECEAVIRAAEDGIIRVCTSVFTMAEVVYVKSHPDREQFSIETQEEIISGLLSSTWLERVSFEPDMAEINRYLMRMYGSSAKKSLRPFDSVHLATAIRMKADYFNTIDDLLIQLLPDSVNCPPHYNKPVIIQRPFVDKLQMQLPSL